MTTEQLTALRELARIFVDVVREGGPEGAPAGPMYAACAGLLTLAQFEQLMAGLVEIGQLRKQGHVYFAIDKATAL